jgi:hypothetical protein
MFCFHSYGEIRDGYQYCKKCGKAILVPCNHKWTILSQGKLGGRCNPNLTVGNFYDRQCEKCGELKRDNFYTEPNY